MAIYLTKESRVLVQGMTGGEGMKHTRRMLAAGTDVVDRITGVPTGRSGMHENVPTGDVVITRAEEVASTP